MSYRVPCVAVDERLLGFVALALVLTITPGPDMALVTRNVLLGGVRGGMVTSCGIVTGLVAWAALSAAGVAALLAASATAFTALKLAGAAYLVGLGLLTLWNSRHVAAQSIRIAATPASGRAHYRQGLLSNLLNPKVGIFYTTLLPQFISAGQPALARTALLAGIHLAVSVAWLGLYSWLVGVVRTSFERASVRAMMERLTGVALLGLGLRVARERG